jgi:hypothetical protein
MSRGATVRGRSWDIELPNRRFGELVSVRIGIKLEYDLADPLLLDSVIANASPAARVD